MILNETIFTKPIIEEMQRERLPDKVLSRVSYPICNIGKKNANDRVYEEAVFDKVCEDKELKEKLEGRALFGHAEHPEQTQSNLEKTSHVIFEMWKDGGKVWQKMDVLDTPTGRIVDTLLRANCNVGVSTRAEGDLEEAEDDEGNSYQRVIPESYKYVTTDFTADPSTFGAIPHDIKRNVVSEVKKLLENKDINGSEKEFATCLLEGMKCTKSKNAIAKHKCHKCGACEALKEKKLSAKEEDKLPKSAIHQCKGCGDKFDDPADINTSNLCKKCAKSVGEKKEYIMEGIWALPNTTARAKKLAELMKKSLSSAEATEKLYNLLGEDELWDKFKYKDDKPRTDDDVRSMLKKRIKQYLKDYEEDPKNYKGRPLNDEAKEILKGIVESKTVESLIKEGTIKVGTELKYGDKEAKVTKIEEGILTIEVENGVSLRTTGVEKALIMSDGVIELLPQPDAPEAVEEVPEPGLEPGNTGLGMPAVTGEEETDEIPGNESIEVGATARIEEGEHKDKEGKVTKIEEGFINITLDDGTEVNVEDPASISIIIPVTEVPEPAPDPHDVPPEEEVEDAEATEPLPIEKDIPESKVNEGVNDKLVTGNLLQDKEGKDWVVKEAGGAGLTVTQPGEPGTEKLISWDDVGGYEFIKISEEKGEEDKETFEHWFDHNSRVLQHDYSRYHDQCEWENSYPEDFKEWAREEFESEVDESEVKEATSVEKDGEWFVESPSGAVLGGPYKSKIEADKRKKDVEFYSASKESKMDEGFEVGDTIQIKDKEGNTTIVPKASVVRKEEVQDGVMSVEISGEDDEDKQQWYAENEYQIIPFSRKKWESKMDEGFKTDLKNKDKAAVSKKIGNITDKLLAGETLSRAEKHYWSDYGDAVKAMESKVDEDSGEREGGSGKSGYVMGSIGGIVPPKEYVVNFEDLSKGAEFQAIRSFGTAFPALYKKVPPAKQFDPDDDKFEIARKKKFPRNCISLDPGFKGEGRFFFPEDPVVLRSDVVAHGKEWVEESISTTAKEITNLRVQEASTRAERDKAIELLEEITDDTQQLKEKAKKEKAFEAKILVNKIGKTIEAKELEVDALRAKLEEKAKLAADLKGQLEEKNKSAVKVKEQLEEIKNNLSNDIKSLNESVSAAEDKHQKDLSEAEKKFQKKLSETVKLSEKKLEEAKEETKNKVTEEVTKEFVKCFVEFKLSETGLNIDDNSRALLEDCKSLEAVDDTLDEIMDASRRGALHSESISSIRVVKREVVDPEVVEAEHRVGECFEGMGYIKKGKND